MHKAWLLAGGVTTALMTSGCVVVVADDGDDSKIFRQEHREGGYIVLDRDGDYSRLAGDMNLRGRLGGDLSLVAGDVDIDGLTVGGEVSIAGGDIDFRGSADGEISIAGGDVEFDGEAGDELSIAAGDLDVAGRVRGEASLAAADMNLTARFEDGLVAQADHVEFSGDVAGRFKLVAAEELKRRRMGDPEHGLVVISGTVRDGGDVCARTVRFENGANIGGALNVWAENAPEMSGNASVPGLNFVPRDGRDCDDILDD